MRERLPDWLAVKGEICHLVRRAGQRLPDWLGDESNGMSQREFEERVRFKESNLPMDLVDPTESTGNSRSHFTKPVEMGT